ncbi:hypothetical protein Tco_1092878 [Tanacetum coccineum]|uniref:Uncharacterized protein n=1 Tax=Tanacetum coccineum TaxID=301880 RepID=A0ABQ5IBF7_9ASTR
MSRDITPEHLSGAQASLHNWRHILLFIAAKILHDSIFAANDELAYDADNGRISYCGKGKGYVKHYTKINTGGPSLLDFLTHGEKGSFSWSVVAELYSWCGELSLSEFLEVIALKFELVLL